MFAYEVFSILKCWVYLFIIIFWDAFKDYGGLDGRILGKKT
jgi:hypothetical protein